MPRGTPRRRGTKTNPGTPVRRVQDPFNPMISYWVDADGNRTSSPKGTGSRVNLPGTRQFTSMSAASNPEKLLEAETWRRSGAAALESLTGISSENSAAMNAALAAMAVVPVPGPLKRGAAAAAKAAARGVTGKGSRGLTQTVGEAVGEAGQRAAAEAAGTRTPKPATGTSTVKPPKTKPSAEPPKKSSYKHASSHSRAVSAWQKKVDAWNKANPNDKVRIATADKPQPGKGKAATDTDRQMIQADSAKTSAEKDTIATGKSRTSADRAAERKAAERAETDLTDVEFEKVLDFVTRLRKSRVSPSGAKGKSKKSQADDILATMRRRLRERDAGTDRLAGLGTGDGAPAGVRNPQRFTDPTDIQAARATAQADRFTEVTGRKFPGSDDAVRREGSRVDPGFAKPKKGSAEARRQRQAEAEAQVDKQNDRTRNLMDGNRLSGEPGSNRRAPSNPRGPDYNPSSNADTAFNNYSRPQPGLRTTADAAEQNVRMGLRDGSVVPGRVGSTPQPRSPRSGMSAAGGGRDQSRPNFVNMTDDDMRAQGYVQIRREYIDENGNVSFRSEWAKPDMDVSVGGPGTPPSLNMSRGNWQTGGSGGPRGRVVDQPNPTPGAARDSGPASGQTTPQPTGRGRSKKPKQQEANVDPNSVEAVRARNYERYRELERQGILEPGDADKIMSGGKGAKEVLDKTPTGAERAKAGKPKGRAGDKKDSKGKKGKATGQMSAAEMADTVNKRLRGSTAIGGTAGIMGLGYGMRGDNNRPVVIPGREFDSKNSVRQGNTRPTSTSGNKKQILRDKFGRKITRDEFNRREAFRDRFGLERLPGEDKNDYTARVRAWRKANKAEWAKELKRRRGFRSNFSKNSEWNRKSRRIGLGGGGSTMTVMDSDAKRALR